MKYDNSLVGTIPTLKAPGKKATKTATKYGNYGSDNFKAVKKAARRTSKQHLKDIDYREFNY